MGDGINDLRRKEAACSCQDGDEDVIALGDLSHLLAQFPVVITTQSVELLGPVEGDDGHSVLVGDGDFLGWGSHFCVVI